MGIIIEEAAQKDCGPMAAVIQKVWETIERKEWFIADHEDYIFHLLNEKKGLGYKAKDTDTGIIAGVFLVAFPGKGEENLGRDIGISEKELVLVAHMDSIAVLPEFRGKKLQYQLMQTAEKELKIRGFRYLMCTVHPENHYSKNNILKRGYEVVMTKEKYGGYIRDIYLKKLS